MLSLLCAYLCVPRRLRFVLRWLMAGLFIVVLAMVVVLFWRVLQTLPEHHGWILHPRPHQPLSPDFNLYRSNRQYRVTKESL